MLKKYVKRLSRSVMGGLGPGETPAVTGDSCGGGKSITTSPDLCHKNANGRDSASENFHWPPHSRKVIDDEEGQQDQEEEEADKTKGQEGVDQTSPLNGKRRDRVCRPHLSSCSSNSTSTTGEEGFGSESSLEELRLISQMKRRAPKGDRPIVGGEGALTVKSSSTSTLSSLSSLGSSEKSLLEMASRLGSALFHYALVFRF